VISADIVIVGAGPAGTSAAIHAAKSGVSSIVIDKAHFPRDKCCGDGLTALALRELELLGFEPPAEEQWQTINGIQIRSPNGREIRLQLPQGRGEYAAVVPRSVLDSQLVDLASSAGAEIRQGTVFKGITNKNDYTEVLIEGQESIKTRNLVAADGMWSPVRKSLGAAKQSYLGDWHAFRQYFTATGNRSRDLWVWFEPDLLPGYAWSFPLADGKVNVGFGVMRKENLKGRDLQEIWANLLDRPHIREVLGSTVPEGPYKAWPIPARLTSMLLHTGPALFVGDAAAAADPMTGEGIGQALETGRLAATAIAEGGTLKEIAKEYERSVRRSMHSDHRLARALNTALSHERITNASLKIINSSDWSRRHFARWMFEDYPRAVMLTPRRWNRASFPLTGSWK